MREVSQLVVLVLGLGTAERSCSLLEPPQAAGWLG